MELLVLGSAGTAPRADNPGAGYLLTAGVTNVLLDAGPGVAMALMGVMDPVDLDAIVLSHRHPDHCSDIFGLFHYYAYEAKIADPVAVFSPPDLWSAAEAFVGETKAWNSTFAWNDAIGEASVDALSLTFGSASHSVPAVCVRATDGVRSLTYSGDTGLGGDLVSLAEGTGTLLCEATYQDATHDGYPFHLSATQAGRLAAEAGVARLVLTHLRSSLVPETSRAEAAAAFDGEVLLAEPGMRIEI